MHGRKAASCNPKYNLKSLLTHRFLHTMHTHTGTVQSLIGNELEQPEDVSCDIVQTFFVQNIQLYLSFQTIQG